MEARESSSEVSSQSISSPDLNTSADSNDAVRYLTELAGAYDTDTLCSACRNLAESIRKADGDSLQLLLERDVVRMIVKMMENLPSHSSAQQAGCDAILSCNEQVELRTSLESHSAFRYVLLAMKAHPDDLELSKKAVNALASLVATAVNDVPLKESKAYSSVFTILSHHPDDAEIQGTGLLALAGLLEVDSYAAGTVARQGDHASIMATVMSHSGSSAVVAHGFECLRVIAGCDVRYDKIKELVDSLQFVVEQLQLHYQNNEDIATAALGLMEAIYYAEYKFSCGDGKSQYQVNESLLDVNQRTNICVLITKLLERYTELAEVQVYGFTALFYLFNLMEVEVSGDIQEKWLDLLNVAMSYHSDHTELNESACNFLSQCLTLYPKLFVKVGDDKEQGQVALHNHLWMNLLNLSCKPNAPLFVAVCTAFKTLIECDSDYTLQQQLLKKGAATALMECLRGYVGLIGYDDQCVQRGCQALRAILMHHCSNEQKQYLLDVGIFSVLQSILDSYIFKPDVIAEVLCVVACLCDIPKFQEAVMAHSLYKCILEKVEKNVSDEVIVEVALEIFIILSLNTDMVQCLNEADIFGVIVSIMKKHVTSSSIQFKGCMLIRLLCDSKYLMSDSTCTAIATVVVDALARKTDNNVQSEALACGQVLCKSTHQMAKALVQCDIHILLFTLLYKEVADSESSKKDTSGAQDTSGNGGVQDTSGNSGAHDTSGNGGAQDTSGNGGAQDTSGNGGAQDGNGTLDSSGALDKSGVSELSGVSENADNKIEEFFFKLGTDIIFHLCCVWDFQQEMLTTSIKDGILEGVSVLVEIGADVNAGDITDTPLCIAVRSKNIKMVELLLEHNIANVSVREALKLSWKLELDSITGLLLEHITVDKRQDSVNFSGLDLTFLKPMWLLPSLGVKSLPEPMKQRRHRKQGSLGHVKNFLLRRKSSAAEIPLEQLSKLVDGASREASRRSSVDMSVLKYVSDVENTTEEVDYGGQLAAQKYRTLREEDETADECTDLPSVNRRIVTDSVTDDSGNGTLRQRSSTSILIPVNRRPSFEGVSIPRGSFTRQDCATISGASTLPSSTLNEYTQNMVHNLSSSTLSQSAFPDGNVTMSPSQLFRKMRKHHPKSVRRSLTESYCSISSPRTDSPIPIIYYHQNGLDDAILPLSPLNSAFTYDEDSSITWPTSATDSLAESEEISREEVDFGEIEPEIERPSTPVDLNPPFVKNIDLSSNKLCDFNSLITLQYGDLVLQRLTGVRVLDLKQNNFCELSSILMKEMMKLYRINLSCNNFSSFPMEALLSPALTEIDISSNKITALPLLPVMTNLTKFTLSHNQLTAMPACVNTATNQPSFPHLKYLDLSGNQITAVPREDTRLRDLEYLNLSRNKIEDLPDEFLISMPSLRVLNASMNELSNIGGDVGQDMVQLQEIVLSCNSLSRAEAYVNKFITTSPVLQVVDVSDNGLTSIPPPYAWKSLGVREIKYTNNKLAKIDLTECKRFWSRVESLYLGQNRLKEIPREIGQLRHLTCLDISHNKEIRNLPDEMGDLEHLFVLNLQGVKNLSLDPNVLNGPTKGIISYLKSRHTRSVAHYRMKMMIVGAAERGKTTLLHQLIQTQTSASKRNLATMGVSVKQWTYQHRRPAGNVVNYHINCWDFAGQDEFYSTHQCFLSQRSLYVLVYNFSRGDEELQYLQPWLLNIQARAPSSPVLVVGTHLDNLNLPKSELDKKRMQMRVKVKDMLRNPGFPTDVSFMELSCFNEKLVGDLRVKVKSLIDNAKIRGQKIMGGLVPSSYIVLEELIVKEKKRLDKAKCRFPVLQKNRLEEIIEENSLKMDKSEIRQAVKFLHECGVILHYSDLQTKLSKLYFLDPEWLCTLMAHVITMKHISFVDDKGFIQLKSLPHVLKEPKFPSEFIPEYIRLLERFEVVLRHSEEKLLIPTRLPKAKPPQASLPPTAVESRLVRRYTLCYIPPGFWPRLLARLMAFGNRATSANTKVGELHVWSGGVYVFWSKSSYYYLELTTHQDNTFDIVVPLTQHGIQLLCSVVDHVEALVDEWFPGLRDLGVVGGTELIKPMAVCPFCPATESSHCFLVKDLCSLCCSIDEIECPVHKGNVKMDVLIPDIIIGDLKPEHRISSGELDFEQIRKNVLGKGGFGDVYKAYIRGQAVAVKIFSHRVASISNTTPNQLIRQEIQILSRLQHPHVIGLVGVCLRPKAMLLLEYAELGSLNSMKPYSTLSNMLKHKIALQISSALAYLHKNHIIYRDLKPGNVLLFSLSTLAKVNAKLTDYGIACYATAAGLTQSVGTPGYRAPELLMSTSSFMPYYYKVDIYSYGLMLFELMTNGHKPFEELSTGLEIDKFILEGRPINDIDQYGCNPWPDMQDLINHCLQYVPSQRPSSQDVFDRMCSSEFISLKQAISIEREHTVETFAIRSFSDKQTKNKNTELWVVSILGSQSMLTIINLSKKRASAQGMMMAQGVVIYSMVNVDPNLMVMGSNSGDILVYDAYEKKLKHSLKNLEDSVLCLTHVKSKEDTYFIIAGLADGRLMFYHEPLLMTPNAKGVPVTVGSGPVRSIKRYHSRLYVACGTEIVVMKLSDRTIEKRWTVIDSAEHSFLTHIEVGLNCIWTAQSRSSKLQIWNLSDGSPNDTLNCELILKQVLPADESLSTHDARITSVLLQQSPYSMLWVGLGSGHILVLNANSQRLLMYTKRHIQSVRCLQLVKTILDEKPVNNVISGGFGFQQRPGYSAPNRGTPETYGSILVWDSIMPKLKTDYDNIKKEMDRYR